MGCVGNLLSVELDEGQEAALAAELALVVNILEKKLNCNANFAAAKLHSLPDT